MESVIGDCGFQPRRASECHRAEPDRGREDRSPVGLDGLEQPTAAEFAVVAAAFALPHLAVEDAVDGPAAIQAGRYTGTSCSCSIVHGGLRRS